MSQFKVMCLCDQISEVTLFCETHTEAVCDTCKCVKHMKCNVTAIEEKGATYKISQIQTVMKNLQNFKGEINALQQERDADCQRIEEMVEMTRKKIETFRADLNKYLDKLEHDLLNELEEKANNLREDVDRIIPTCTATMKLVEIDEKMLDEATSSSNAPMIFAADVRISKRIDELQSTMRILQEEIKSSVFEFEGNQKLLNLEQEVEMFGNVRVVKLDNISIRRAKSSREVCVQFQDEYNCPLIGGCVFMEDGQLLLSDIANENVKLLSSTFESKQRLELKSSPYAIAVVDAKTAIVSLPERDQLQFIQVKPSLMAGETVKMDKEYYGIGVLEETIYVLCPDPIEVCVLDIKGNLIKKIPDPQNVLSSLQRPMGLAVNRYLSRIYLADFSSSVVSCVTFDGTLEYKWNCDQDNEINPFGVITDERGNFLICGKSSCSVHLITSTGQKHSVLYTVEKKEKTDEEDSKEEDSDKDLGCYSTAYRASDRTLVIGLHDRRMLVLQMV